MKNLKIRIGTVNALTKFVGQLLVVHLKLLLFLFKVEQEDVNQEDLRDAMEDDEIKIKVHICMF